MSATYPFQPRDFYRDIRTKRLSMGDTTQLGRPWPELPPGHMLLVDPAAVEFETPVDSRGLVDVRGLVALCKSVVREEFEWNVHEVRDDHLEWPGAAYARLAWWLDDPLPVKFCNCPSNIVRFPLQFERLKHGITIPADFPSIEVMGYQVEAWATARRLFLSMERAVKLERLRRDRRAGLTLGAIAVCPTDVKDQIAEEYFADTLAANFKGVAKSLELHQRVPPEFRIVQPQDNARDVLRRLGYQVKHRCRDGIRGRQSNFVVPRQSRVA